MSYAVGRALGRWWGRQSRVLQLAFGLVALLVVTYCARSGPPTRPAPAAPSQSAVTLKPVDPRDLARGVAARMVLPLRKAMKDPNSFELEDAQFMADDSACYTYFARNSFNARVRGWAVWTGGAMLTADIDKRKFEAAWKKHCEDKSGEPLTAYINMYIL